LGFFIINMNYNKITCGIFRHAINKKTLLQINPHTSKELCDLYINNNLVYGCAKPFTIINNNIEKCDYI